jgi:protease-4
MDERSTQSESNANREDASASQAGAQPNASGSSVGANVPPGMGIPHPGADMPPGGFRPHPYGAYGNYGQGYPPGAYRPMPKKKMKTWKKALLIAAIAAGSILIVAAFIVEAINEKKEELSLPGNEYLARISVVGEIGDFNDTYASSSESYHHSWTMRAIDRIIDDENNKGLLIYVDSPGGTVYESDALCLKIKEYKEKTERPVYVYMGSIAASGGYYISAPADKIYANRNTWTGSIGVIIGTLFDVSGFLERYGIKATDITSGANKGMGGYFEPMTDEQRALFQSMVDEAYGQFVGIVAEGRGLSEAAVREIADGRIMTAKQALDASLIDEIALERDAVESIKEDMGYPDIDVEYLDFKGQSSIFGSSFVKAFADSARVGMLEDPTRTDGDIVPGDISRVLELAQRGDRVPIKYMYRG